jgi:hypothetical protein
MRILVKLRPRYGLTVLLAVVVLVATASPAMAKIAPDNECRYLTNNANCTEYNLNDAGTTAITINVNSAETGTLYVQGTIYAPPGSGCTNICAYNVLQLCGTISGIRSCHSYNDELKNYISHTYAIPCSSGNHTVSGEMTWRIWNRTHTTYQQGVYGTKNLSFRC